MLKDGFWALGSTKEGCEKCGCDVGGSVSSVCDDISGSCQCKRNLIGRQCNLVQPGYYVELLSQNKYEGEDSVPGEIDVCLVAFVNILKVFDRKYYTN